VAEQQMREGVVPPKVSAQAGAALARIHSIGAMAASDAELRPQLPCQVPWPLTVDQQGYGFLNAYGALGAQLTQAISQSPVLASGLPALRALWQYDSLVHGDMKWDNCLMRGEQLVVVDWELVDLGDGAWDVASIFKEYLASVLLNHVSREAARAQKVAEPAEITLDTTRPSLRAFWKAYCHGRGLSGMAAQQYLDRAVRYLSARLIIAVLEYCSFSQQMDSMANLLLESSRRIMEQPQLAAAQLAGVPAN
jgi:aminoglycoside phosphotransferase (APT) family kinase protein